MNNQPGKLIFKRVSSKSIPIQKVCEVGVYLPETSNIIDFINQGKDSILVEPEPKSIEAINSYFKTYNNITLFPIAIYKENGQITLSKAEASTFLTNLPSSPALINDNYTINDLNNIEVECKVFSDIDKGDIDLLSIDTEGSEWYVLLTMISRPKIISIETHGKFYLNPFLKEINEWIKENNYEIWYKDLSDTVYFQKGVITLTLWEKVRLLFVNFYLWFRRNKKYLKL